MMTLIINSWGEENRNCTLYTRQSFPMLADRDIDGDSRRFEAKTQQATINAAEMGRPWLCIDLACILQEAGVDSDIEARELSSQQSTYGAGSARKCSKTMDA